MMYNVCRIDKWKGESMKEKLDKQVKQDVLNIVDKIKKMNKETKTNLFYVIKGVELFGENQMQK